MPVDGRASMGLMEPLPGDASDGERLPLIMDVDTGIDDMVALLIAATALGYGAQWITEWYGYSQGVRAALKLADNERVAGFVYIGTAKEKPEERERPSLADIAQAWRR